MLKEFREFIARGNAFELAVGIIIGAALAAEAAGVAVFRYGSFTTAVINFLIIAWVVFLMVRTVNKIRARTVTDEKTPETSALPTQEELLMQIRDILRDGPPRRPPAASDAPAPEGPLSPAPAG